MGKRPNYTVISSNFDRVFSVSKRLDSSSRAEQEQREQAVNVSKLKQKFEHQEPEAKVS